MSNEILKKFASELKAQREGKGLTIDELHAHTRIDKKFLEAIEDGNFSVLPEVYVRAFIREYSAEIGLDPEETLRKFDLAKEGYNFTENAAIEKENKTEIEVKQVSSDKAFVDSSVEREKEKNIPMKQQNRNIYLYAIGGVLLIILLYLIFSPADKEQIVVERKYAPDRVENPQQNIKPREDEKIVKENPFNVELLGSDTVWIRAKIDNSKTEEFTLVPKVSRIISVKDTLRLVIGNAAGVKVNVNNKPIIFSGKKGEVRNLIITRNGLAGK